MSNIFTNLTSFTHLLVEKVVNNGDSVIDATAGNGFDTLFLASLVGEEGKVYSFDIQKEAIDNTIKLLKDNNKEQQVKLFNCSHQYLDNYIAEPIKAVMFNLGYLPKGDHLLTTLPSTTIEAIKKAMKLLSSQGIITIMVYTGHQGGYEESKAVEELVSKLDKRSWDVLNFSFLNRSKAPHLIVLFKKGG